MSFHVTAHTMLILTAANTDVPALQDDYFTIQNTHFLLPEDRFLIWGWVAAATLNRARLFTPSIGVITRPFIRPIDRSALPTDLPSIADFRANPFRMRGQEELVLEATSGVAVSERFTALFGWTTQTTPAPAGDIYTLRATSVTAAVANSWTSLVATFDNQLPAGEYAVVGLEVQSANALGARLIFPGGSQKDRPGSVSVSALGNDNKDIFRKGGLGDWGRFRNTVLPTVQVLAQAADAAHEIYLDIVPLARGS